MVRKDRQEFELGQVLGSGFKVEMPFSNTGRMDSAFATRPSHLGEPKEIQNPQAEAVLLAIPVGY